MGIFARHDAFTFNGARALNRHRTIRLHGSRRRFDLVVSVGKVVSMRSDFGIFKGRPVIQCDLINERRAVSGTQSTSVYLHSAIGNRIVEGQLAALFHDDLHARIDLHVVKGDICTCGNSECFGAEIAIFAFADNAVHARFVRAVNVMQANRYNRISRLGDLVWLHIP